jgi:hypothetical protein
MTAKCPSKYEPQTGGAPTSTPGTPGTLGTSGTSTSY